MDSNTPISFLTVGQLKELMKEVIETINLIPPKSPEKIVKRKKLDVNQASRFLGVSESTIYQATSQRRILHHKQFKTIYFFEDELLDFLDGGKVEVADQISRVTLGKMKEATNGRLKKKDQTIKP